MQKEAFFEGSLNREYSFESLLDRTAQRPFVYRAMMPWLINRTEALLPDSVAARYQPAARTVVDRYSKRPDGEFWTDALERKFMIAFVWTAVFALGALLALRSLVGAAFPQAPLLRDVAPVLFATVLPLSFMNGGFMYDFPELCLTFAAFAFAWRGRLPWMLLALGLAVLNKETAALLVPILSIVLWHLVPRRTWAVYTALASVVAGGLVLLLRAAYSDLPGTTMYDHVLENAAFWSRPSSWFGWMTVYTPLLPMPRGLNLLMVLPLVVVLAAGWKSHRPAVRRTLVASAFVNLPLFFLFCWRDETRNLSLMYPALCLAVCEAIDLRTFPITESVRRSSNPAP
jgi:hypothetical protein